MRAFLTRVHARCKGNRGYPRDVPTILDIEAGIRIFVGGMLRKFISIKSVGRFLSSAAVGNPQLSRHVLMFGANGFGKTTLCAILRSLQSGDATGITGRKTLGGDAEPLVDILADGGNALFQDGAWSRNIPEIAVFDATFVAENVHSGDVVESDHKRNLYRVIIGREGVALAQDEERLALEIRDKQSDARTAERVVEALVPLGIKFEDFLSLLADPDIDAKIAAQEQAVAAALQASQIKARSALKAIAAPALPASFAVVLTKTLEGIAEGAEGKIAAHLTGHVRSTRPSATARRGRLRR